MEIVNKIVLTGGPCAGKTSVLNEIKKYLEEKDYKVFIVSETATELINSGIKMFGDNPIEPIEFQKLVFKQQLFKETLIQCAIESYDAGKAVIIYDRGLLDNKAYITKYDFDKLLREFEMNESDIYKRYDTIIHLNTSALLENAYTLENNKARSESKEEAIKLDEKTYYAWCLHPNCYTVKPEIKFDIKLKNIFKIIDDNLNNNHIKFQYKKLVRGLIK